MGRAAAIGTARFDTRYLANRGTAPVNLAEIPLDLLSEMISEARDAGDTALLTFYVEALEARAAAWTPQDYQRLPTENFSLWLFLAGRFVGKTDTGAHNFDQHAMGPPCDPRVPGGHRMRLIGPTSTDTIASCVEGPTGLKAHNPKIQLVTTKEGTLCRWPNGAVARVFGAFTPEDPERLRAGGNSSLAAGTLISTERGAIPIQEVRKGERVWTEAGLRTVLAVWEHGIRPVWRMTTEVGRSVLLTADHKVWLPEGGWIRCDEIRVGSMLTAWNGGVTAGSALVPTGLAASATGRSYSTESSTSPRSDPFRPGSTSTIATAIRTTTDPRTLLPSILLPTMQSIPEPRNGMRRAGEHPSLALHPDHVNDVERPPATSGSVPAGAGAILSSPGLPPPACGHASCAVAISTAPATRPPLLAQDRVATISPGNVDVPVWDLTVAGEHDFFADGVLVANCFDWYEELAAWRQLEGCWDQAVFGLRLGDHAQAIATTTPKNRKKIRELRQSGERFAVASPEEKATMGRDERIVVTTASTADNKFGDPEIRAALYKTYAQTRLGAQELEAKILDDLGTFFSRSWFGWLETPTLLPRKVRSWDLAGTPPGPANENPDWTVGVLIAYDPNPRPWTLADGTIIMAGYFAIENVVRLRDSPAAVEQAVVDTARQDGPMVKVIIEKEPGQSGKSQVVHFQQALQGIALVEEFSPSGPKNVRAQLVSGAAQQGRVDIVRGPWNQALLDELEEYTGDEKVDDHDDQVDGLSQGFAALEGRGGLASAQAPSGQLPSRSSMLSRGGSFADSMRNR